MKTIRKIILCIFLCSTFANLSAQWNALAINDYLVYDMKAFNGKLFIGGNFLTIDSNFCRWYTIYNDTNFVYNTVPFGGIGIQQMTEYNNTLYAVGEMGGMGVFYWNGNSWQPDTAFHIPGNPVNNRATAIFADGNDLYVGDYLGYVHKKSGNNGAYSLLSSTPFYGNHWIKSIAKFNNKIVAAGDFTGWGTTSYIWRIAQWDSGAWKPLNRGLNDAAYTMSVYDNELYVGGYFTAAFNGGFGINTNGLVKWNDSIWTDVTAGNILGGVVNELMIYNNELYVGGNFPDGGGNYPAAIAKWNGINWTGLGFSHPPYGAFSIEAYNNCIYMAALPILCNPQDTDKIIFKHCLSVGQSENMNIENDDLELFPNPVINFINISFNTTGSKVFVIYNYLGQKVRTFISGNVRKSQFDLTELPPGIYFLEGISDERKVFKKFIKL